MRLVITITLNVATRITNVSCSINITLSLLQHCLSYSFNVSFAIGTFTLKHIQWVHLNCYHSNSYYDSLPLISTQKPLAIKLTFAFIADISLFLQKQHSLVMTRSILAFIHFTCTG